MNIQAVFLDRDGTINVERSDYVKSLSELELLTTTLQAMAELGTLPIPVMLFTNQSAIGRGQVTQAVVEEIHAHLIERFQRVGGRIDAIYMCPHHPQSNCSCRKPKPGLLQQAAVDFDLELSRCVVIGDSITDYWAAQSVQSTTILVRTGRQGSELDTKLAPAQDLMIVDDLLEAVRVVKAMHADAAPQTHLLLSEDKDLFQR